MNARAGPEFRTISEAQLCLWQLLNRNTTASAIPNYLLIWPAISTRKAADPPAPLLPGLNLSHSGKHRHNIGVTTLGDHNSWRRPVKHTLCIHHLPPVRSLGKAAAFSSTPPSTSACCGKSSFNSRDTDRRQLLKATKVRPFRTGSNYSFP